MIKITCDKCGKDLTGCYYYHVVGRDKDNNLIDVNDLCKNCANTKNHIKKKK